MESSLVRWRSDGDELVEVNATRRQSYSVVMSNIHRQEHLDAARTYSSLPEPTFRCFGQPAYYIGNSTEITCVPHSY